MQYFERQNDSLIFRLNGETVMVSPWGEDSLRTRAALFNELSDNSPALLSPAKSEPVIELGERQAVITNGKIHAVLSLQDWGMNCRFPIIIKRASFCCRKFQTAVPCF